MDKDFTHKITFSINSELTEESKQKLQEIKEEQYKEALKRSEWLLEKEEAEKGLIPALSLELYELIELIEEYEKDMIE